MADRPSFRSQFLSRVGGAWEVDPTTRCVTVPVAVPELVHIAELHALHGSNLLRRANPQATVNAPRLDSAALQLAAKLEHELDHLQRHLATGYGFIYHLIRSRLVDLFFERLDQTTDDETGRLPWYPLSESATRRISSEQRGLIGNLRLYQAYRSLLSILAADSSAPNVPSPRSCRRAYAAFATDLFRRRLNVAPPTRSESHTRPRIGWYPVFHDRSGRPFKLGATGLLEALAISREMSLMRYAKLERLRDTSQFGASIYGQASYLWQAAYKLPMLSQTDLPPSWREVGYLEITTPPWEFQAAIDLALWTPLGPDGGPQL